ncbi:MAG: hypothetical protein IJE24_05930 [Oscillospiraceae bacterium]|nr:hypothetical protein [Oscillospiraceae bacterium]
MLCTNCEKQIDAASTPETASANASYSPSQPAYTPETFHKRYAIAWREFVTQPFALVLMLWFFVSVLLNILQVNALLNNADSLLDSLGVAISDFTVSKPIAVLAQILLCAPGALIVIGMWLIYDDAHGRSDRPVSATGSTLIYITTLVNAILIGIGYVVSFFLFIASTKYLSTSIESATILTYIFFGIVLGSIPAFYLLRMYVRLVAGIRENVKKGTFSTACVKVAAILDFIVGGLCVIAMFAFEITLCSLLTATLPLLVGVMLLKYKRFMDDLHWEYLDVEYASSKPRA